MTEQQPYEVLKRFPVFEVRRYPAHLVAEVEVDASFTRAGNEAFGVLVGFISGRNSTRGKVAMTAPVLQEQAPTTIEMTSPVVQQPAAESGRQAVAFVMPSHFTLETLPTPPTRASPSGRCLSRWPRSRASPDAGRSTSTRSSWATSAPL